MLTLTSSIFLFIFWMQTHLFLSVCYNGTYLSNGWMFWHRDVKRWISHCTVFSCTSHSSRADFVSSRVSLAFKFKSTENMFNDTDQRGVTKHCSNVCIVQFILNSLNRNKKTTLANVLCLRIWLQEWNTHFFELFF